MPDEEVDMNRYHYRPGTTEPELRPEFAAEAAKAAPIDDGPVGPSGKKPRAARKTKVAKKSAPASKKK